MVTSCLTSVSCRKGAGKERLHSSWFSYKANVGLSLSNNRGSSTTTPPRCSCSADTRRIPTYRHTPDRVPMPTSRHAFVSDLPVVDYAAHGCTSSTTTSSTSTTSSWILGCSDFWWGAARVGLTNRCLVSMLASLSRSPVVQL